MHRTPFISRSLHLAIAALFALSVSPKGWADETAPDAAPPTTSDLSNEGAMPPASDPGMSAGNAESAPPPAEAPVKKKKKKAAKKKSGKHGKHKAGGKKKKKKKHHSNY